MAEAQETLAISILNQLFQMSTLLNGLSIPIRSLDPTLRKYAGALLVHSNLPGYSVYIRGSCSTILYRGRYFLVCTRHQLKDVDLSRVSLHMPGKSKAESSLITSGGVRQYTNHDSQSDYHDITAFDYSEPCSELRDLRDRFFPLNRIPPDTSSEKVAFGVAGGYAYADQKYELDEADHLGLARRLPLWQLDGQSSDPAVLRVKLDTPLEVDPDGLSGGPAFVVQFIGGRPEAFFAGMVQRGGREHLHILKAGVIKTFLDAYIDEA